MDLISLFSYLLIFIGAYFFVFALTNILAINKDTITEKASDTPLVSVLIPARNEHDNIANCLSSFINQDYPNYEVLVLDDNSTDDTAKIVKTFTKKYPRIFKLYSGKTLPSDWRGKSFAMKQLTEKAKGEYFLFTDADTIHTKSSISLMINNILYHQADLVSGYINQTTKTFGEQITIPLMYLLTGLVIPIWMNDKSKLPIFATAIGQYIGVKATSFMKMGGYDKIKQYTTEDIYLAREMKKNGYKTVFIDAKEAASCRMYNNYDQAVHGISKNIFDFLGKNSLLMFCIIIAVFLFLVIPFPLGIYKVLETYKCNLPELSLLTSALILNAIFCFFSWLLLAVSRNLPIYLAFIYPLIFTNLLYIALVSWIRSEQGQGYMWKGRLVP